MYPDDEEYEEPFQISAFLTLRNVGWTGGKTWKLNIKTVGIRFDPPRKTINPFAKYVH